MFRWLIKGVAEGAWAPVALLAAAAVAASFHAFLLLPWIDMPAHLLGGAAMAHFFRAVVANAEEALGYMPLRRQRSLAFWLTIAAAAVWEAGELYSDLMLGTRANLGVRDTVVDLVCGAAGAWGRLALEEQRLRRAQEERSRRAALPRSA